MLGPLTTPIRGAKRVLRSTTLRGFNGGLNIIDDPHNLAYKYAIESTNIFASNDGSMRIRYGTQVFVDTSSTFSASTSLINITYFNGSLIVVGANGQVVRVQANGTKTLIWSNAIAALLPGAPSGWSATGFASFAQFNGDLIICNGVDKPIIIDVSFVVDYLQDIPTASNVNVPICRYVVSCQRYLVMAGDPLFPNRVHISARDASGTWFGDPAPNDATHLDIGSIVESANIIRGLMPFRDKLLVLFAEGIVIGTLGTYDTTGLIHTPDFNDGIKDHGCISHRSTVSVGDDGLLVSLTGVPSIKRTILSSMLKAENASEMIDPLLRAALAPFSLEQLEDRIFSVYDKIEGQYLVFIPIPNSGGAPVNRKYVYAYNYRPKLRQESWSKFTGWKFTCACSSLDGEIFFGDGDGVISRYGSRDNPIAKDNIAANGTGGDVYSWQWTLPWLDFGERDTTKTLKHIAFDTYGNGTFTAKLYGDDFRGGARLQTDFAFAGFSSPTAGTDRNTMNRKLIVWPAKFMIVLLDFSGSTSSTAGHVPGGFVSITMQYQTGTTRM